MLQPPPSSLLQAADDARLFLWTGEFRDRRVDFSIYQRGAGADEYLRTLGPLARQERGSRAGLDRPRANPYGSPA